MTKLMPAYADLIPWYGFAVVWAISSLRVKRAKAWEASTDRITTITAMTFVFLLLFYDLQWMGPLRNRFAPFTNWMAWTGVVLTWAGIAVAVWARSCIGQYWSARVTLKEDHQLIRTGPYRFVRHPIYSGMLLGVIGRALTLGTWSGVLAIAIILVAHWRKALREESMLTREFGQEYSRYRRSTGFLFPRLIRAPGMDTRSGDS